MTRHVLIARQPPPRTAVPLVGAVVGCALLVAVSLTGGVAGPPGPGPVTRAAQVEVPLGPAAAASGWTGSTSWDQVIRATPTRVRLPGLGVDAAVLPVSVRPDGELGIPDDPHLLGWWQQGAHPGGPGAVVIAGHVDTARDGAGALFRLAGARAGQALTVETNLGPHRYVVTEVRRYAKADLPAPTFSRTGPPHLALITCGGEFDTLTHQYADNVVVYADPG